MVTSYFVLAVVVALLAAWAFTRTSWGGRYLMFGTFALALLVPVAAGLVARSWLVEHGQSVISWARGAEELAWATVFAVLPPFLVLAALIGRSRLPNSWHELKSHRSFWKYAGANAGLALTVFFIFTYMLIQRAPLGLLLFMVPLYVGASAVGAFAGGYIGFLLHKMIVRG